MSKPLFTVEFTSIMEGLGLVLEGFTADQYGLIKPGNRLKLRRPNGSIVFATIVGVDYSPSAIYLGERPKNPRYGIVVDRYDIPVGTEVFLESDAPDTNEELPS